MCLAKGFTGGMLPMAATLATGARLRRLPRRAGARFYYGHSFCGNPLGAAVAREVLAVFRDEDVLERAAPKARAIAEAFERVAAIARRRRARERWA